MQPDLSKLSDKDLEALANGDMASMSDAALAILAGEEPKLAKATILVAIHSSLALSSLLHKLQQLSSTKQSVTLHLPHLRLVVMALVL